MNQRPSQGLFVTGTDTDIGKTFVSCLIAKALCRTRTIGVYKPVASGCLWQDGTLVAQDAELLWKAAGRPQTPERVAPQRFAAPLAPHLAAAAEGTTVDAPLLRSGAKAWSEYEVLLVEGVGGLMSPISDVDLVVDVAVEFGYPLVVIVPNVLGAINQALQTLAVARQYKLSVAALVINDVAEQDDPSRSSNAAEIRRWTTGVPVFSLPHQADEVPNELVRVLETVVSDGHSPRTY